MHTSLKRAVESGDSFSIGYVVSQVQEKLVALERKLDEKIVHEDVFQKL